MFEYFQEVFASQPEVFIALYIFSVMSFFWCLKHAEEKTFDNPEYEEFLDEYSEEIEQIQNSKLGSLFGILGLLCGFIPFINIVMMAVIFTPESYQLLINIFNWPLYLIRKINECF